MSQRARQFKGAIKEIDLKKHRADSWYRTAIFYDCGTWWWEYNIFYRTFSQKGSQTMKFLVKHRASTGSQGCK